MDAIEHLPSAGLMGENDLSGTLGPLVADYLRARRRMGELQAVTAAGVRSTLSGLCRVHGQRPIGHLGRRTVERWLETRDGLKASTRATQWSQVSTFLDWLVRRGVLQTNPCQDMTAPRRPRTEPRTIEESDIEVLLGVVPDARARVIVLLEWGMGARRIEVHRANVEHWSRRGGEMLLIGKGGHERTVSVPSDAAAAFDAYLSEHPATVGPLIRSYTRPGSRLSPSTLTHYVSDWMLQAGVKHAPGDGVSGHALRRTCASELLDLTGDLRVVQEVLGHAHLSSSAPYLRRMTIGAMREAMAARTLRPVAPLLMAQQCLPW